MEATYMQRVRSLELEEQILNLACIVGIVSPFLPWSGGQILGTDPVTYTGFGFYTGFLGIAVFLLHTFILLVTVIPLAGGRGLVRREQRDPVRFFCAVQAVVLVLAALSVLTKVTLEFSRMEVRFGVYVALVASVVVAIYAYLRMQSQRKSAVEEMFYHHRDTNTEPTLPFRDPLADDRPASTATPPPPPAAEEHRHHPLQRP